MAINSEEMLLYSQEMMELSIYSHSASWNIMVASTVPSMWSEMPNLRNVASKNAHQEEKFDSTKSSVMGTWVRRFMCCREAAETGCGGAETKGLERWAEEPLEDRSKLIAIGGCESSGLHERED
jgi:hypothetical protein